MQTKKQLREEVKELTILLERANTRINDLGETYKSLSDRKVQEEVDQARSFMRYLGVLDDYRRAYPSLGGYLYSTPGVPRAVRAFQNDLGTAIAAMDADDAQDRLSGNFKTTEKGE